MRHIPLLLSAAFLAMSPALASAADASKASVPAAPVASATSAGPVPTPAAPAAMSSFTDAQRAEIEGIIKTYLVDKSPEVLMEAMQELQKRQTADVTAKSKVAIGTNHDKVYNDPNSPVAGNPKGDVTLVEFFDYQCGYCKMAEPNVEKLLKEDKNVKLIYKDFPILGPASTVAAKAAIASIKQGKYIKFHDALMAAAIPHNAPQADTEAAIYKVAKDSGLDVDKLKKDMADNATDKIIEANIALGGDIGARGTPTFILDDNLYPGAMEYDGLKAAVAEARKASTAKKP